MGSVRLLILLMACLLSGLTTACLWDDDTLRVEASGKMDIVHALTGRFERWPDRYYEMRLERVTAELDQGGLSLSDQLDRLDNAAVALDRLKRHDEAVAMIERKRKLLESADPAQKTQADHWYRFYANAGTLYAHRWFANGADREAMADIERGRDLIAKAIQLNPGAHFGREDVQLLTMDWVVDGNGSLARYFNDLIPARITPKRAQEGLVGLVTLGNAWESIDVFETIGALTSRHLKDSAIAELAMERVRELQKAGKKSLVTNPKELLLHTQLRDPTRVRKEYAALRKDADQWAKEREDFVLKRLGEGKHPDTDPDFWDGYQERPARPLDPDSLSDKIYHVVKRYPEVLCGLAVVLLVMAVVLKVRRLRRGKS